MDAEARQKDEEVILTGPEIRKQIELGNIEVDPFVPEHVNPASVDLTLGDEVLEYAVQHVPLSEALDLPPRARKPYGYRAQPLDAKKEQATFKQKIYPEGIVLEPGRLYLMHTVERVRSKKFVCVLDGKSSLGRLGVSIHQTAGYGDPYFDGQYTMEVTCVLPVRLYAGMRVAQMRFHAVQGEIQEYAGNYVGEAARGPVASRSWRQFK